MVVLKLRKNVGAETFGNFGLGDARDPQQVLSSVEMMRSKRRADTKENVMIRRRTLLVTSSLLSIMQRS
jgi:hypothetical protein